jgi:GntR family transcriptional regulator
MTLPIERLDRESDFALYEQVTNRLRVHLSGLAAGAQVPTEAALTEMFEVGRSTIRKAMQLLVNEGVLIRRPGKGTFIARPTPKIIHPIDRLMPFMQTFRKNGEDVATKLIDVAWFENIELPDKLKGWKRPILQFNRLYLSRGVPHAVARVYLPHEIGREISAADIEAHTTYDLLIGKLGLKPSSSSFMVSCRQPPARIGKLLELSQSQYLLVLERITYDKDENPLEMTTHFLRPDVYKLNVSINHE